MVSSTEDARLLDVELKTARETLRAKMLNTSRQTAAEMQNASVFHHSRIASASNQPVIGVSGRDSDDSLTSSSANDAALPEMCPSHAEQGISPVDAGPGDIVARSVHQLVLKLLAGVDSGDSLHALLFSVDKSTTPSEVLAGMMMARSLAQCNSGFFEACLIVNLMLTPGTTLQIPSSIRTDTVESPTAPQISQLLVQPSSLYMSLPA
jgi:hypothetical protein